MARGRRAIAPDKQTLLGAERVYGAEEHSGPGEISIGLCYPNRYPVAMANLGYQTILARLRNHPACEVQRFFFEEGAADLTAFESGRPAGDFDILAFSVSFENDYVHMLRMLHQARIPLRRTDRKESDPLIVVGGAVTSLNPEPLRPFVDIFLLGEGEEMIGEFLDAFRDLPAPRRKGEMEGRIVWGGGAYVPALHLCSGEVAPRQYDGMKMDPAVSRVLTPYSEFSDTLLLEISRGCPRRCRFCTVGSALPKFRMLPAERAVELAERFRTDDERLGREPLRKVGLVSAAFFDHVESESLAGELFRRGFGIGVSSLRVDQLTDKVLGYVEASGTRTITVAPEAGSERLRRVIRKEASDATILEGVEKAARAGFRKLRVYYMIGLPYEEEEDLQALVRQALEIRSTFLASGPAARGVTVSLHPFVPKPRTAFQWSPMIRPARLKKMVWTIRRKLPGIKVKCVSRKEAYIEGILARSGEEIAPFLESLAAGETWPAAARATGTDLNSILYEPLDRDRRFAWESAESFRGRESTDGREMVRAEKVAAERDGRGGS